MEEKILEFENWIKEKLEDPYNFVEETAGYFDLDAELKINISGMSLPIEKKFSSGANIYEVQAILAAYCSR